MQGYVFDLYLQCQQKQTTMDTKTARQIAKELGEQAKKIKEIAKDHKNGVLSEWAYKYRLDTTFKELETIMDEFKYYKNSLIK